ncbi:EAL domain-containing protein [Bacillus solimangrovi]|uniref:EAL domain-containing protein n=1 Tax=Bacillus solimangrovi TaxID=1305675 RepID=A0A1E5LEC2_9BACI|nr:EAL domain-containing protein [Bacillus solimangrovi]OEH92435.1 hypothetical protein BFG57_15755 [Bacillus solimangrovi]
MNIHPNVKQLRLHHLFQPIMDTKNMTPHGYEAFLRSASCTNPMELFQTARKLDYLYHLDTTSIKRAISLCSDHVHEQVFLNVFPSTLLQDPFLEMLSWLEQQYEHVFKKIVFEINEANEDYKAWESNELIDRIQHLRKLGIPIALDDVGTGQASLQRLIECAPNYVKLDKYFSKNLTDIVEKKKIVSFFSDYCKNSSKLILEGIENERDLHTASELNVDYVQGYLFGKPDTLQRYKQPLTLPN